MLSITKQIKGVEYAYSVNVMRSVLNVVRVLFYCILFLYVHARHVVEHYLSVKVPVCKSYTKLNYMKKRVYVIT